MNYIPFDIFIHLPNSTILNIYGPLFNEKLINLKNIDSFSLMIDIYDQSILENLIIKIYAEKQSYIYENNIIAYFLFAFFFYIIFLLLYFIIKYICKLIKRKKSNSHINTIRNNLNTEAIRNYISNSQPTENNNLNRQPIRNNNSNREPIINSNLNREQIEDNLNSNENRNNININQENENKKK